MRRRILRWYVRLKRLEPSDTAALTPQERTERLAELDAFLATCEDSAPSQDGVHG